MKLDLNNLAGRAAIVGAGPGDPELLTLRAHRLLAHADVVLCDRLVNRAVLDVCPPDVRIIDVGKDPNGRSTSQDVINHLLLKEARSGAFVVRLKGGDPFVFGRGAEEGAYLHAHGVEFEVVPGISSSIGAPASAGIPVTLRGVSNHFTVVTGMGAHEAPEQTWEALGATGGTIVVLMGIGRLTEIAAALMRGGRAGTTPAALVQEGTTSREVVAEATLATIAATATRLRVRPPAVLVVGEVVRHREALGALSWSEEQLLETVG